MGEPSGSNSFSWRAGLQRDAVRGLFQRTMAQAVHQSGKRNLNDWRPWLGISAVFLALCLPSAAASAGIIGVGFAVTGADTWGGRCGAACIYLDLSGTTRLRGLDRHFVASGPPRIHVLRAAPSHPGLVRKLTGRHGTRRRLAA